MARWDIVCDNDNNFSTYSNGLFFLGNMVGVFFLGFLADWYGRKRTLVIFSVLSAGVNAGVYFAPNKYIWLALRFLCGACLLGVATAQNIWKVRYC